jgi:hypothetical protein
MNRPFVAGIDPLEVKIVSPVLEPLIDPPLGERRVAT